MTVIRIVFLLAALVPLLAQTETGKISGTVSGADGAPASSALLEVSSEATGFHRTIHASSQGIYTIADLLPGEYRIHVSAAGLSAADTVVVVTVGSRTGQDFSLGGGRVSAPTNQAQTLGQVFTGPEIRELPNLTRDPYQFVALAGNVSDAGLGTRGAGVAINGQRESSTNILLDGGNNNDEFYGRIGQQIPLDAVKEFAVLTSGFTAEFGRASGGIVNVASRSGSNLLHGTAYEFNRNSGLASNSFRNNANGIQKQDFSRNQFGYAVGGPIIRNKLFFFSSTEGTLVRSDATVFAWVPTSQLIAQSAAGTQNFFQTLGQLRKSARSLGMVSVSDLTAIYGRNPCTGLACATLPTGIPLFNHVAYTAPTDAGAGEPQNTWNTFERIDYNLSARTQIYARYALSSETDQAGSLSNSPYDNYDLGQTFFHQNALASLIHTFSPSLVSETKAEYSRLTDNQQGLTSRGIVPSMYANPNAPVNIGNDSVAFPGYNPFTPGSGGVFGGPQNLLQFNHDVSWNKGSHSFRFGGAYQYIRDNRTDASFLTAFDSLSNGAGLGPALNGLLAGRFAQITVAIKPNGTSVTLPATSPNFVRSNRFHDSALYAEDSWKLRRRVTVNMGVRWEHFGVQHNGDPGLDSNFYAPGVGFADNDLARYLQTGSLQIASKSTVGGLYKPDWKDFAPRFGIAWDVFGDGRTSVRGGYGIGYERNFGNVTFNVDQNGPNYAVITVPGPVSTSNFGPLLGTGGSVSLPPAGARIIDPDIKTAYAHFWSAAVQREVVRDVVYSLEYSGSKGVNLYSISYPNQAGFGSPTQPNPNYSEDVGYRGNQGFSTYYGLNNRLTVSNLLSLGLTFTVNYTWSHAVDNLSSTFFETGAQNITINNGAFDRGLLDPYHPNLDKGDAEFDVRHRVTLQGDWRIPLKGRLLGGWSLHPIYTARSGQPFSIFDTTAQTLDLSAPRATFVGKVAAARNSFVAGTTPDTFHILTFLPAQISHVPNPAGRDAFRGQGWWNFDLGIYKDTRITERFSLQLRAESFNLLNHANLYTEGLTADVGSSNTVEACYGCSGSAADRRQIQLAAKLIF